MTDRDKALVKGAIPLEKLTSWMAENELLSIILSGSIDQAQYCEKVKKIVEHVGPHLSKEDLEKLWSRTVSYITTLWSTTFSVLCFLIYTLKI